MACISAFRLIDALRRRPLPVAGSDRLYVVSFEEADANGGRPFSYQSVAHPLFRLMRAAVPGQAGLIAVSQADRKDLTYRSDEEIEKAYVQFVSGWMFDSFRLRPVLGRLLNGQDDVTPGANPYAVLSHDYWTRRFGNDPRALGSTFQLDTDLYTNVGVVRRGFTGQEPGTVTDIFIPTMMNVAATHADSSWLRTLVQVRPGVRPEAILQRLRGPFRAFQEERAKSFAARTARQLERFVNQVASLEPARAGVSTLQRDNRLPLAALASFFAVVAVLLAGVGLYGVLHYSVVQRRREIGIRIALGAPAGHVARVVTVQVVSMVLAGALAGRALGIASARHIQTLFYEVGATDPAMLALPALMLAGVALLAALPAIGHAVRTDPVTVVRAE